MKKLIVILTLITAALLNGCATKCTEEIYYKPELPKQISNFEINRSDSELEFRIDHSVYVSVSECGWAFRPSRSSAGSLCLRLIPETGTSVYFETDLVQFTDALGKQLGNAKIEKIGYSIFCEETTPEKCSSGTTIDSKSEVERTYGVSSGRSHRISVDVSPLSPFVGTSDSQHGYIVSSRDKLRRYEAIVSFPAETSVSYAVALPAMIINGRKFELPSIKFQRTTEKMCFTSA